LKNHEVLIATKCSRKYKKQLQEFCILNDLTLSQLLRKGAAHYINSAKENHNLPTSSQTKSETSNNWRQMLLS